MLDLHCPRSLSKAPVLLVGVALFLAHVPRLSFPGLLAASAFCPPEGGGVGPRRSDGDGVAAGRLYGVPEWRAKFSPPPVASKNVTRPDGPALPLLLLPFSPDQILLPGERTTLTFRHGKYMDIIDECITSYEGVVGLSILSDDGLLPTAVVCEVIEDELDINMGYRGFSSMEVGVRAVGRARRCDFVGANEMVGKDVGIPDGLFLGRTAQADIHSGTFSECSDDVLDNVGMEEARGYVHNIKSLLELPSSRGILYENAYKMTLDDLTLALPIESHVNVKCAEFAAASWAALASVSGEKSSHVITHALSTKDTVERLRMGLAAMLEDRIPGQDEGGTLLFGDKSSDSPDGSDAFQ